jgi:hypothetical protein
MIGNPSEFAEEIPIEMGLYGKHVAACALLKDGGVTSWVHISFRQLGGASAR